ncbi:MAG: hypothetical protein QOG84_1439 [Sphingomonadales bacterium]|jgi:hypothetical protein|nr:hypothetical protein [Sphingomonadales bacterium]
MQDEIKFHSDRAMSELDMASRSADMRAAEAHLRLSALHLERMRRLTETVASPLNQPA